MTLVGIAATCVLQSTSGLDAEGHKLGHRGMKKRVKEQVGGVRGDRSAGGGGDKEGREHEGEGDVDAVCPPAKLREVLKR